MSLIVISHSLLWLHSFPLTQNQNVRVHLSRPRGAIVPALALRILCAHVSEETYSDALAFWCPLGSVEVEDSKTRRRPGEPERAELKGKREQEGEPAFSLSLPIK